MIRKQHKTQDAAIAECMRNAADGTEIAIHDVSCKCGNEPDTKCTCEPLVIKVGAKA